MLFIKESNIFLILHNCIFLVFFSLRLNKYYNLLKKHYLYILLLMAQVGDLGFL